MAPVLTVPVVTAPVVTADSAFSWGGIAAAMGLAVYGAGLPDGLSNAILTNTYISTGSRLYRLSATENAVASFTLEGFPAYLSGVAAVNDSTTTIMVSAAAGTGDPSVGRFVWDGTQYNVEATGAAGGKAGGGVVAGGRYWQFSGGAHVGQGYIRSWPLTGDLDDAASQTLSLDGTTPLFLPDIPGNQLNKAFCYSLAVQVDTSPPATHVFWMNQVGKLLRYSDDGANPATASIIASTTSTADVFNAVAMLPSGGRLYVAHENTVYYVDDPASGTTVTLIPMATPTLGNSGNGQFRGGAQTRAGSVVFARNNNTASSVIRLPTP